MKQRRRRNQKVKMIGKPWRAILSVEILFVMLLFLENVEFHLLITYALWCHVWTCLLGVD